MKINTARYAVTSAFGAFAVGACVVAYPQMSGVIITFGSAVVGMLCAGAAEIGEQK